MGITTEEIYLIWLYLYLYYEHKDNKDDLKSALKVRKPKPCVAVSEPYISEDEKWVGARVAAKYCVYKMLLQKAHERAKKDIFSIEDVVTYYDLMAFRETMPDEIKNVFKSEDSDGGTRQNIAKIIEDVKDDLRIINNAILVPRLLKRVEIMNKTINRKTSFILLFGNDSERKEEWDKVKRDIKNIRKKIKEKGKRGVESGFKAKKKKEIIIRNNTDGIQNSTSSYWEENIIIKQGDLNKAREKIKIILDKNEGLSELEFKENDIGKTFEADISRYYEELKLGIGHIIAYNKIFIYFSKHSPSVEGGNDYGAFTIEKVGDLIIAKFKTLTSPK